MIHAMFVALALSGSSPAQASVAFGVGGGYDWLRGATTAGASAPGIPLVADLAFGSKGGRFLWGLHGQYYLNRTVAGAPGPLYNWGLLFRFHGGGGKARNLYIDVRVDLVGLSIALYRGVIQSAGLGGSSPSTYIFDRLSYGVSLGYRFPVGKIMGLWVSANYDGFAFPINYVSTATPGRFYVPSVTAKFGFSP